VIEDRRYKLRGMGTHSRHYCQDCGYSFRNGVDKKVPVLYTFTDDCNVQVEVYYHEDCEGKERPKLKFKKI
jgi:hypothetical protein